MELAPELLAERLVNMDYDDEPEVSIPGEFSRHGGIVDVFSPAENYPARIEYFGDSIDTIRLFSPETQRSFESVLSYRIILRGNGESYFDCKFKEESPVNMDFFDYLNINPMQIVTVFPAEIEKRLTQFGSEGALERWQSRINGLTERKFTILDAAESALVSSAGVSPEPFSLYPANANILQTLPEGAEDSFADLVKQVNMNLIRQWLSGKFHVVLAGGTEKSYRQIKEWIRENDLHENQYLQIEKSHLPSGVFLPSLKLACLSERDLFVVSASRFKKRWLVDPSVTEKGGNRSSEKSPDEELNPAAFADLEEGDYAVHINHGICIYRGLKNIHAGGTESEMIALEFSDEMILNIPVWQAHLITRYIGSRKG